MSYIFELTDKTGRKIRLTREQWSHIRRRHPEVEDVEIVKETIVNPDKITDIKADEAIFYYYKYYKHRPSPDKFLLIAVKYINEHGFVLSAYYVDKIK